ncbi:hypothetical protein [Anaerosporobacter sp.]|uniref:hypothetical protein n=1 Tax=Anaerosporobacter sp. TaxID=1872529 RepID=UPI00286ED16E|nr:hypothetical protein [Anaerosporobacter sp.]
MEEHKLIMKEACARRFAKAKEAIDKLLIETTKETILIGIDGKCASGKTTLGYYLKGVYDCNLFHLDDFFLQEHQRTKERLAQIGGNVDYERFKEEVMKPVCSGNDVIYRPYSCMEGKIKEEILVAKHRVNIMEGSYSLHPYFNDPYDVKIFMNINEKAQIENIRTRNGEERLQRFIAEWIPKETVYFETFHIAEGCIQIEWNV